MVVSIPFFLVFMLIMFIGSIIMFYVETKDYVYKILYFVMIIFSFSLLVFSSYYMIGEDFDYDIDKDKIVLDDHDLNNLVWTGTEVYDSATTYFVFEFKNVELDQEGIYSHANFCFYYNNTDSDPNVVRVVNGVNEISDYVYLLNNTFGSECVHINASYVNRNALLGLVCLDCSVQNELEIPEAQTTSSVTEIHITKGDPLTYTLENHEEAHVFWIEAKKNSGELIYTSWFIFMVGLFGWITSFGFRWGYKWYLEGLIDEVR